MHVCVTLDYSVSYMNTNPELLRLLLSLTYTCTVHVQTHNTCTYMYMYCTCTVHVLYMYIVCVVSTQISYLVWYQLSNSFCFQYELMYQLDDKKY